jgi:hypothetical protein
VQEDLLDAAVSEALAAEARDFRLYGSVSPLLEKAVVTGYRPRRRLGGWLATFGKIGPNGGIVPTVDRDGHVFAAARQLGLVDWSAYLEKGLWNDRHFDGLIHKPETIVGIADTLEFADEHTSLGQAHRKVGFFTTGHLFDRADPRSWEGLGRTPRPHELAKSDEYWELAQLLDGTPRELGFSAHGKMALGQDGCSIAYAKISQCAIAQLPKNPDATVQLLSKACAAGPISDLAKAVTADNPLGRAIVPEDLEATPDRSSSEQEAVQRILQRLMDRYNLSKAQAQRALNAWLRKNRPANMEA